MSELTIIPHEGPRVETGPLQFGSDWPGIFIRGDNAMYYGMMLETVIEAMELEDFIAESVLLSLSNLLLSCDARQLRDYTDLLERLAGLSNTLADDEDLLEAIAAIRTLQAENERLREQVKQCQAE